MAVTGVAGKRNIEGYQLDLQATDEIYAGTETILSLKVTNSRRFLPALLLRVELDDHSILIPIIPAQGIGSASIPYRPPQRGHNRIDKLRISSPFPVAFFFRYHTFTLEGDILAFPSLLPLKLSLHSGGIEAKPSGAKNIAWGQQGIIAGISDYSGSEPLKRIHWRLSARHDILKVKELESDASEPLMINPRDLPGATYEEQLSGAAWLIDRTLRLGRPVGLQLGTTTLSPGDGRDHKLRLLRYLALADAD